MAIVEEIDLTVDNLEIVKKTVDKTAELEVGSELENGENLRQFSSPPILEEAATKSILEDAIESVVVATAESVIDIKECVGKSSGLEATFDIGETEYMNGDSTFITEIEDTEEIMLDKESVENITQLERTLNESEKEFPVEEAVGEVNEVTPEEIIDNKIEITEPIESEAQDESLVIDVTEPVAKESALTEEVRDTETDIIAEQFLGEVAEVNEFRVVEAVDEADEATPEVVEHIESLVIDATEPEAKESALTEEDTETDIITEKVVGEVAEVAEFPVVEADDEADEATPEKVIENKIEVVEPIEANDESLVIDVIDSAATEDALTEEAKDAETNIISEKNPINIVTTDVDGIEKSPFFTLVMVAYVVFMAVFVMFN